MESKDYYRRVNVNSNRLPLVETIRSNKVILANEVWVDAQYIPISGGDLVTVLALLNNTSYTPINLSWPIITRYIDAAMTLISGTFNTYYCATLINMIPSNYTADYNYRARININGDDIPISKWEVNSGAGTVTFAGTKAELDTLFGAYLPTISFWQYVGMMAGDMIHNIYETVLYKSGGIMTGSINFNSYELTNVNTISGSDPILINGNLAISGNLLVSGNQIIVNTETVTISDNIIRLNSALVGTPPLNTLTGIEVYRGTSPLSNILFRELDDAWVLGEIATLSCIATREDMPVNNAIGIWDSTALMFKTYSGFTHDLSTHMTTMSDLTVSTINNLTLTSAGNIITIGGGYTLALELSAATSLTLPNVGIVSTRDQNLTNTASSGGTLTLVMDSKYVQRISGTLTHTVVMPDVTTLQLGHAYHIVNDSSGNITVNSSGANLIVTLAQYATAIVTCIAVTGTNNTSWFYTQTTRTSLNITTQLNYLSGATGTTGTNLLVYNTSPTLVTPTLGVASATSITIPTLTSGSIAFAGTGGILSQNNSKLFWDNSNNRLGVCTAAPKTPLQISTFDLYQIQIEGSAGVGARYYPVGSLIYTSQTYGIISLRGLLCGDDTYGRGAALINIKFSVRGTSSNDQPLLVGTVHGTIGTESNLRIYKNTTSGRYEFYIYAASFPLINLDLKVTGGTILTYDGTYSTTAPTSTLFYDFKTKVGGSGLTNSLYYYDTYKNDVDIEIIYTGSLSYYELGYFTYSTSATAWWKIEGLIGGDEGGRGRAYVNIQFSTRYSGIDSPRIYGYVNGKLESNYSNLLIYKDTTSSRYYLYLYIGQYSMSKFTITRINGSSGIITYSGTTTTPVGSVVFNLATNYNDGTVASGIIYTDINGNVGTSSVNPLAKLHVNNTSSSNSFLVEDSTSPDSTPFVITQDGSVGVGLLVPNASALLDLTTTTQGLLIPRMTTTQKNAITSPATGLVVYDTTESTPYIYTSAWNRINMYPVMTRFSIINGQNIPDSTNTTILMSSTPQYTSNYANPVDGSPNNYKMRFPSIGYYYVSSNVCMSAGIPTTSYCDFNYKTFTSAAVVIEDNNIVGVAGSPNTVKSTFGFQIYISDITNYMTFYCYQNSGSGKTITSTGTNYSWVTIFKL